MTRELFILLCAGVLLLPTLGALIARMLGARYGQRSLHAAGIVGFGSALLCALIVGFVDTDRLELGSFGIFIPRSGPLIDSDVFTLRREPLAVTGAAGGAIETPESSAEVVAVVPPMFPPTDATIVPTPVPSEPTLEPTAEPTSEPTLELTSEPTLEPTSEPTLEPTSEPTLEPTAEPTAIPSTAVARGNNVTAYTVARGDTLRGIAERFDMTIDALLQFNGLTPAEGDQLSIGQQLYIPRTSSVAPVSPAATRTPQRTVQPYVVKSGDTLRSIAATFNITVDALLRFNGITRAEGDQLSIGQRLFIPAR